MSASLLFFYLSIVLGYVALRPLCTLVHESGHLLFLLLAGKRGRVAVYLGSLGARKGTLQIRTGRITWVLHPSCLLMRGSLCDFETPLGSHQIPAYALAGPLASLALAFTAGGIMMGIWAVEAAFWIKPLLILMALIPLMDFFLSLFHRNETIQLSAETVTANDGQLIGWWLAYGKMTAPYLHASWLFEKERYAAAIPVLEQVRAAGIATKELEECLVYAALATRQPEQALQHHARMLARHRADPFDLCRSATALEQLGRRTAALVELQAALKLAPGHAEALNLRAYLGIANGDHLQAKADLDLAIASQPDYAPALCNRAALHLQSGNPEAALADLQKSMKEDAEPPELHLHWSAYHLLAGNATAARAALETARLLGLDSRQWEAMQARLYSGADAEGGGTQSTGPGEKKFPL